MSYIKLDQPGARHVLRVKSVSVDTKGKWPDYHFTDGTVTVVVPKGAADRQITKARLGTDVAFDLVGSVIEVSRTEKVGANGKPFWDINLANAEALNTPAESPRMQSPYQTPRPQGGPPPEDADDPGPQMPFDEPAYTPREQAAGSKSEQREQFIGFYLQVYETMLSSMERTHADSGTPLGAEAVQAATATVIIQMERKGML